MFRASKQAVVIALMFFFAISTIASAAPTVGVVLGGGAARGFSHIGLIQAMEENGVPIDLLVGTSMGSIISSLYAVGYSVDNMRQIVTALDTASLIDLAVPPKGGFIDVTRLQVYLDILLGQKTFAELQIPFYSVITNIQTGEEVALDEGKVSVGVQASMSIPALFPPVVIEGEYYVDGGMKNAVPANVAKDNGADVIIAVDVKKELESINHDSVLTNLQLSMWFMIDGYVQTNTTMADVIIVPEVKYDSYMDYQKVGHFIEEGYLAGLAYMDQIQAAILAEAPDFQFIPYSQEGVSERRVAEIMQEARKKVDSLPRPLRVIPEIGLDSLGEFPQLGLGVEHGPLAWFSLGYRYGFSSLGGHEVFLELSNVGLGKLGTFVRQSPRLDSPTWGALFELPISEKLTINGVYLNQGPIQWQVSSFYPGLLATRHLSVDLGSRLTRIRAEEGGLVVGLKPTAKVYPFGEPSSFMEVTLVKPYLLGGVELYSPLAAWDLGLSYDLGIGAEMKLFGLYPIETGVGVRIQSGEISWRFSIAGGSF